LVLIKAAEGWETIGLETDPADPHQPTTYASFEAAAPPVRTRDCGSTTIAFTLPRPLAEWVLTG
jgi:hypothetical protein